MPLEGKQVFVAGATGMVGTAILKCLLRQDSSVLIRATCSNTTPFLIDDRIEYVRGDLRSPEDCQRMVGGCQYAIMAAARTSGAGGLTSQPWQQVNDNLFMNATVLQALAESTVSRLILVGSATLYQDFDGFIREDQLDLNTDPPPSYFGIGWVTRYIEKLCAFWHQQRKLDVVMVRASNVFGPYARFDARTSNFIPALIRKAGDRMDPFVVWGTPDVTRDVVYADDFARAVIMLLERADIRFDAFNIGADNKTTVGDVVSWVLKASRHVPSQITYNTSEPTTVPLRALDCGKIRQTVGWSPRYTVEEGIKATVSWWELYKDRWTK